MHKGSRLRVGKNNAATMEISSGFCHQLLPPGGAPSSARLLSSVLGPRIMLPGRSGHALRRATIALTGRILSNICPVALLVNIGAASSLGSFTFARIVRLDLVSRRCFARSFWPRMFCRSDAAALFGTILKSLCLSSTRRGLRSSSHRTLLLALHDQKRQLAGASSTLSARTQALRAAMWPLGGEPADDIKVPTLWASRWPPEAPRLAACPGQKVSISRL